MFTALLSIALKLRALPEKETLDLQTSVVVTSRLVHCLGQHRSKAIVLPSLNLLKTIQVQSSLMQSGIW